MAAACGVVIGSNSTPSVDVFLLFTLRTVGSNRTVGLNGTVGSSGKVGLRGEWSPARRCRRAPMSENKARYGRWCERPVGRGLTELEGQPGAGACSCAADALRGAMLTEPRRALGLVGPCCYVGHSGRALVSLVFTEARATAVRRTEPARSDRASSCSGRSESNAKRLPICGGAVGRRVGGGVGRWRGGEQRVRWAVGGQRLGGLETGPRSGSASESGSEVSLSSLRSGFGSGFRSRFGPGVGSRVRRG